MVAAVEKWGDAITDSHLDKESKGNEARILVSRPNARAKTAAPTKHA
jgi:hypothetical protein